MDLDWESSRSRNHSSRTLREISDQGVKAEHSLVAGQSSIDGLATGSHMRERVR